MKNNDSGTDRNISVSEAWNLIGSDVNFSLADVNFTNSSGSQYTWANAITNNKVQAYLTYYDSSPATASSRKYKYLSTVSGMDDTSLRKNKGYWIYMNERGNLSLPLAGGTWANETYDWDKLRFWNGSDEKSITEADSADWIFESEEAGYINYYNASVSDFKRVCDNIMLCPTATLNSWRGYFIYSNADNLTLIRQN